MGPGMGCTDDTWKGGDGNPMVASAYGLGAPSAQDVMSRKHGAGARAEPHGKRLGGLEAAVAYWAWQEVGRYSRNEVTKSDGGHRRMRRSGLRRGIQHAQSATHRPYDGCE